MLVLNSRWAPRRYDRGPGSVCPGPMLIGGLSPTLLNDVPLFKPRALIEDLADIHADLAEDERLVRRA